MSHGGFYKHGVTGLPRRSRLCRRVLELFSIARACAPASVQHRSDLARIHVLSTHWMDASCMCPLPVETWVDFNVDQLQVSTLTLAE